MKRRFYQFIGKIRLARERKLRLEDGILLLTIYPEIKRDVVSCLDVNVIIGTRHLDKALSEAVRGFHV